MSKITANKARKPNVQRALRREIEDHTPRRTRRTEGIQERSSDHTTKNTQQSQTQAHYPRFNRFSVKIVSHIHINTEQLFPSSTVFFRNCCLFVIVFVVLCVCVCICVLIVHRPPKRYPLLADFSRRLPVLFVSLPLFSVLCVVFVLCILIFIFL